MVLVSSAAAAGKDQVPTVDVRKTVIGVASRCESAKTYSFEGDLQIDGQRGETPGRILSKSKLKLAVAPGGKYLLHVEPVDKDEYLLVSDGQKSWAYVPRLKQYSETEGATIQLDGDDADDSGEAGSSDERDLAETFARLIVPTLGRMAKTAESANAKPSVQLKFEGRKQTWPVIQVISKKSEDGQNLTEIAADPETLKVGRLLWANVSYRGTERSVIRMTMEFTSFQIGEVPESTFSFEVPKKAKLVDAVPIPGQTGSFLLNRPAPDFEAKTLDGERVRLSELKDRTVLLNFWASWCGPCRRELPSIVKLHEEFKDKGLVILGVNDEDKGTAKSFAGKMGLTFPTIDDSRQKLHRDYRVNSIPTIFLIDREGKIVRFLKGSRDEDSLRKVLQTVGF